ncbi:MAG: TIM barrel protein [Clostridiales bacterium]|nr:TIM barrel protein [Clostridiales bacterium]
MNKKRIISLLLACVLLFTAALPAAAAFAGGAQPLAAAEDRSPGNCFTNFFKTLFDRIKAFFDRLKAVFTVKKEKVRNTMRQNAIHMLKSVSNTIGDSFIITTEDGKVIVIDGGYKKETDYFVEYLKAVTGQSKPHIDAWFLSHAHADHCCVFLEVVENRSDEVSFDKVYANFPEDPAFYADIDEEACEVVGNYNRLKPLFEGKYESLAEGGVFSVGAAEFKVFYVFDGVMRNCNENSTIMRMDLGGTSVMWTGDAGTNAGNYVVGKYGGTGEHDCDYCNMSHHGQGGADKNFYEAVSPELCMWPSPSWVYECSDGTLQTAKTRAWVEELGVKKEYMSYRGSAVIGMIPRIVTTTDVFEDGYDAKQAARRLAGLGYEGIDMGLDYWTFSGSPFMSDGYLEWARELKENADALGIEYTHAHAPGEADSEIVGRSIEVAAALGARYLVIHPVWQDKNGNPIRTKLRFLQVNAEAYKKWLPTAEEYGVVLLAENILWYSSANPKAIADLVKTVDSDWFGWCFDVGHAWCSGYSPDVLKKCAVAPMSIHIQDNDGSGDQHLIPGDGTIDMTLFAETLREIGYLGDCVLESHHQSLVAPDAERDAILARLLDVSKEIREQLR